MRRGVLTLALLSAWLLNAAPAAAQDEVKPWVASAGIGGSFGSLGSYGGGLENLSVEVMGGRSINSLFAIVGEMGGALHVPEVKASDYPFVSTDFSYIAAAALNAPGPEIHLNGLHWNANIWITPALNFRYLMPYITGGYGGYTGSAVRETDFGLVHNNIETSPAGNVGGGIMIPVYKFVAVRADYRAYFISAEAESVTLNQFSVTVGVGGRR